LEQFIKVIKPFCRGFPCVSKIDNYTGASHRVFLLTEFGIITIHYFEDKDYYVCKSKRFITLSKIDTLFTVKDTLKV
jgi:hypothetical protein